MTVSDQIFIDIQDHLSYSSNMNKQDLKKREKTINYKRKEWVNERRRTPRIKEDNKVTITVISGEENLPKKKSTITSARISLSPVSEFRQIYFCPSILNSR